MFRLQVCRVCVKYRMQETLCYTWSLWRDAKNLVAHQATQAEVIVCQKCAIEAGHRRLARAIFGRTA
mgnify:CR=1 FL=1